MTQVLHSFADLAAVLGNVKAKKVVELASFANIEDKCGRNAAIIWAFLQDQEACKHYGPKGAILHDANSIVAVTGYDEDTTFNAVITLVTHGYAKLTANGQQVRAA